MPAGRQAGDARVVLPQALASGARSTPCRFEHVLLSACRAVAGSRSEPAGSRHGRECGARAATSSRVRCAPDAAWRETRSRSSGWRGRNLHLHPPPALPVSSPNKCAVEEFRRLQRHQSRRRHFIRASSRRGVGRRAAGVGRSTGAMAAIPAWFRSGRSSRRVVGQVRAGRLRGTRHLPATRPMRPSSARDRAHAEIFFGRARGVSGVHGSRPVLRSIARRVRSGARPRPPICR